jgi:hypothetical protein
LDKAIQQSPRDRYFSAREMLEASQISSITITGIPPTTLPSPPHPTQAYTAYPYSYYLLGLRLRSWLLIGGSSTQKNIWEIGKRLIPLACGGAFLGGVIAQLPGAIIGVVFGGVFGCFTTKNRRNTSSSRNTKPNVWRRGNQVITLASGGAFIGGLTAQIPGAILGSVIGALFGWFTRTQTNH